MSSDDTPPTVRNRTRPDADRRDSRNSRRRRRINTSGDTTPPPRDVMDPGPVVQWPDLPRNEQTGEVEIAAVRQRIRDLHAIDKAAATEFILETLHMLLLQHRPLDDIARIFGVNVSTIYRWRIKLRERIAADFRERVPTDLAAEQVANLKRTKSYAWQQASRCTEAIDKWRWIQTTIKLEAELRELYKELKVYKAVEPRREVAENNDDGAASLAKIAEEFLTGGYAGAKSAKDGKQKEAANHNPDDDLVPPEFDENDVAHMF